MEADMAEFEVFESGSGEYDEKKSRFLGVLVSAQDEEAAQAFVREKKKEHYDARHNCYAYITADGAKRYSDDGEPSGTAGRPILEVLEHKKIQNAVLVVTRYFGGVLLGTGGLTRAYGAAAKAAVENAVLLERHKGRKISVSTDYSGYGKIEHILRSENIPIVDTIYLEGVTLECMVEEEAVPALVKKITDETAGQAVIETSELCSYGVRDGKVIFL